MGRDFAAYLFTLFCPLFTSGVSFSIAHEYSVRNLNSACYDFTAATPTVSVANKTQKHRSQPKIKQRSEETQTLRAGAVRQSQKISPRRRPPFRGRRTAKI